MVTLDNEVAGSLAGVSDPGLTGKIESFVQPVQADTLPDDQGSSSVDASFQTLADEFSVSERTSVPISIGLAEIVNGLLKDKLPKEKLQEVQPKYVRPENCPNLVPPKVNKQIWQQMRQDTRNTDSALQKAQGLMIAGLCAVLEVFNKSVGDLKRILTHSTVLLLAANREFNLKRRDLIRPDLNKHYGSLCNPSMAISTQLLTLGMILTRKWKRLQNLINLAVELPLNQVPIIDSSPISYPVPGALVGVAVFISPLAEAEHVLF